MILIKQIAEIVGGRLVSADGNREVLDLLTDSRQLVAAGQTLFFALTSNRNDGHKYMEVHDHKWLQWNLDYNFCGGINNHQSFYIIKRDGNPVGFFMLKFRHYAEKWRMKDEVEKLGF